MDFCILTIPFVGAFIGWMTIVLFFKFLFHPREPVDVGMTSIQGIIPKSRGDLADILLDSLESKLQFSEELRKQIEGVDLQADMEQLLDHQLDRLVLRLRQQLPMAGTFLQGSLVEKVKAEAKAELLTAMPELKRMVAKRLVNDFDMRRQLKKKLAHLDSAKLEDILLKEKHSELAFIALGGAILGLLIGTVYMLIIAIFC